jgi:uncharacterized protein YndB with AHSA1/START domain
VHFRHQPVLLNLFVLTLGYSRRHYMEPALNERVSQFLDAHEILLRAPRARVWRALTNTQEFGSWFGVNLTGTFAPGAWVSGKITHKGYEHLTMDITIERMEPERLFSWRWHPGASPPGPDEPMTLVVFELEDAPGGTLLTLVESGFDKIPLPRRAVAFRDNDGGWTGQVAAIEKHLAKEA